MRPLLRLVPPAWSTPATLAFSGMGTDAIRRVFQTATPLTNECLALLEGEVAGRALTSDELAAAAVIWAKLASEYKKATPALLDAFGGYCAYCELRLDDPVQLEHAMPKSQYPAFALDWKNFLPACIGCNSRKNDQPLRATIAAVLPSDPPPTPGDFYDAVRTARYRWPDLDATWGFFSVKLNYQDAAGWHPVPEPDSVGSGTIEVADSVRAGTVLANIPSLSLSSVAVAAVVYDRAGSDQSTLAMIQMCGLDRWPVPSDHSDRRTMIRTQAWLTAVTLLRPLVDPGPLPAALPDHVRLQVRSGGFYWVWLTVASLISPDLQDLFVSGLAPTLNGTDGGRLP